MLILFLAGHAYETGFKRLSEERKINLCRGGTSIFNIITTKVDNSLFQALFDNGC